MPDGIEVTRPGSADALSGRVVSSAFRPHPLLAGGHRQTIVPSLLRPMPELRIRRERLELADGDFVDLGWSGDELSGAPIATLVHGLGGGFESKYLRGMARHLNAAGWRTVILLLRGGGDEPNRLARSYHHGDTADLRHLWHLLKQREPNTPVAAIGWSLGGNVVLRAVAEEGEAAPLIGAAAVSVPFQLLDCAHYLGRSFGGVYQRYLLGGLRQLLRRKAHLHHPAPADYAAALAARDFFAFDSAYTAPLNGFLSAEDYYQRASCGPVLRDLRKPTLILHAVDDPFMPPSIIPGPEALAPAVTLEVSASGGHVGFVGADARGRPSYWLESRIAAFLDERLKARLTELERAT